MNSSYETVAVSNADQVLGTTGAYLSLPGTADNYASTPDSVANSVTGDLDLRADGALDDYTPAAAQVLLSKQSDAGTDNGYEFLILDSGILLFRYSPDGALGSMVTALASAATGITDGSRSWLRCTYNASTGAVNFYKSDDGLTWVVIGAEQSITAGAIFNNARKLAVGARSEGESALAGRIYYAEVRNGIDGTVVAKFDPLNDGGKIGDTSFTASTGEVWTINQSGSPAAELLPLPGATTGYELIHRKPAYYATPDLEDMLAEMRVKHYVIDRIEGPNDGQVRVVLKDLFSLVEARKAVAPLASLGELNAGINAAVTAATLSPAGIGNLEYPASGHIAIGDEVCAFTRSGDALTITRGQLNTVAAAHDAEDLVQLVLSFSAQLVHDIIYDLLTIYGGIAAAQIDKPRWDSLAQGLTELYTGRITTPTPVNELVGELMLQAGCTVWPDVSTGMIAFGALQAATVSPVVDDDAWLAADRSLSIKRQDAKRVSQVWVYYGQIRPNEDLNEKRNYRSRSVTVDLAAEDVQQYGTPAIREIFSRWIPQFGRASAERCGERLIAMFRDAPLEAMLPLHASRDGELNLAQYFALQTADVQDDVGAMKLVTMAPVEIESSETEIEVKAQQVTFAGLEVGGDRVIYIENDSYNLTMREIHDSLYAAPTGSEVVRFIVLGGVTVGSTSTASPGIRTGTWPAGVTLTMEVQAGGRGQGKAGVGGIGDASHLPGTAGSPGGPALLATYALFLTGSGELFGGGGGGGAGAGSGGANVTAGGGGGAGTDAGDGGYGSFGSASSGTADTGGAGGSGFGDARGGAGGGPGLSGVNGSPGVNSTSGGAAGAAIDGVSFVTFDSPNLLDIRGPQI